MGTPRIAIITFALAAAAAGESFAACKVVDGKAYGDCNNVPVNTGSKRALQVRKSVSESAIIDGATVHSGGSLSLSGVSNGDIIVNKGATLYVSGVVNGTIRNLGGAVEIEGTVRHVETRGGNVTVGGIVDAASGGGPITLKKGAVIAGVPTLKMTRTTAGQ